MSARARRTVYCASKHAMEGFTKAMAIELAPHNIRVNSLGPTFLETPMTRPFFENKAFRDEVLGKIKLGRLGQLDELTGAIVFLASDASSLMTGSALVLDGGWTAEYQVAPPLAGRVASKRTGWGNARKNTVGQPHPAPRFAPDPPLSGEGLSELRQIREILRVLFLDFLHEFRPEQARHVEAGCALERVGEHLVLGVLERLQSSRS